MKKLFYAVLASAAVVLSIESCQKNEIAPEYNLTEGLVFSSEKPDLIDETKTAWTGKTIKWSKDDAIRVAYTCDDVWQNANGTATKDEANGSKTAKTYQSTSLSADAETAKFSVPGDFKGTAEGTYVFYGAYPASACTDGSNFSYAPSLTVTIPESQTPAADSFDSAADFMLGKSVSTYTGIPKEAVSMNWDRMVAHAQLTFKTLNGFTEGETISKVELTADSEADMVGKHYINLDKKNVTKSGSTVANALTINGTNLSADETGTFVAWASFLPCTVKSLTVVVTTDKATYTREIASRELVFKKNERNVLAINMSSAIREECGVASLPFEETFAAITTGNSTETSGSSTNVTDAQMANFSNYANATYQAGGAVRIGKSGSLETKNLDLSKNFYVVVTAKGWSSSEVNLTVSAGEQSETVRLETYIGGNYKDYKIYFNAVSSSSTVKFTTNNSTRCFIDNIRIEEGSDHREPLTAPENLSCTAQTENSLTFSWDEVSNASGYQVSVDGGNTYGATQNETSYTWTGLTASTTKTLYVKAIGDGISYTDSDAASAEGTTTAGSGSGETPEVTTVSLDENEIKGLGKIAYTDEKVIKDGDITWAIHAYKDAETRPHLQLKKDSGVYVKITAPSAIKEVRLTITSSTNSKGGVEDIAKHTAYSSSGKISLKSADAGGDTSTNDVVSCIGNAISNNNVTLVPNGSYTDLYLKVSAGARIWGIEVDY